MTQFLLSASAAVALALGALLYAPAAFAHGDGDHAHDEPATLETDAAPRIETSADGIELVGEIADRKLTIYLDRSATNAPIDDAEITLTVDGIAGGKARRLRPGTFEIPAPWADDPGVKPLQFSITIDGKAHVLRNDLTIAEAAHEHAASPQTWEAALGNFYTWVIAAFAAMFGFVLAFAFRPVRLPTADETSATSASPPHGTHGLPPPAATKVSALFVVAVLGAALAVPTPVAAHEGHDHGPEPELPAAAQSATPRRLPNGDVYLPKVTQRLLHVRTTVAQRRPARRARELIGTVVPDPSFFGQVQAPMDGRIELPKRGIFHVGERVKAGEVLAYLAPSIPIADLGTMQQLRAEVAGKLKIAEQKLARLKRIATVVAKKEIDDTRTELEALREQQSVLQSKDADRIPLKAPVAGVIAVANVRAGQVVTTRDTLFEIVDPDRLWIEAIGGAEHNDPDITNAYAIDLDNHALKLTLVGRAPSLRQQTQPLQFRIDEPHEGLTVNSAVKVLIQQGAPVDGVVLPAAAVVRAANGMARVWAKEGPQLFRPLPVRVTPLDGENVLVRDGVPDGERIVIEGAELINQVR